MSELTKVREGEAVPDCAPCVVYAGGCWHIVEARQVDGAAQFFVGKHRVNGVKSVYRAGE